MNVHITAKPGVPAIAFRDGGVDVAHDLPSVMAQVLRRHVLTDTASLSAIPSITVTAGDSCEHDRAELESLLAAMMMETGNSSGDNIVGMAHALINPHACEPKHTSLNGIAMHAEVICLASGPSAQARLPWVLERQRKGSVVVCADSIYRGAVAMGIRPDFVCVLERDRRMAAMVPPEISPTTRLVCPPVVDPAVVAGWEGRRVWMWQSSSLLYDALGPTIPRIGTGRSAGTLAVLVTAIMRPQRAILVGHDLCEIDSISHANQAESLSSSAHVADLANPGNTYHRRVTVECMDGALRPSTLFWQGCRSDIEAMVHAPYAGEWFQASERGAKIAGAKPLPDDMLPIISMHPIELLPAEPSRYNGWLRACLRTELPGIIARIDQATMPPHLTSDSIAALIPQPDDLAECNRPVYPLVSHCIAVDVMAANLRMHKDCANGVKVDQAYARAWQLLRRRMGQSLRTALHLVEA